MKGLEPLAHCLEGSCSIHLSYKRIKKRKLERVMGIEPTQPAWKAGILPLNYTRTKAFPRAPGFGKKMERVAGIEPTSPAGKAGVLALNYARISTIGSR